MSNVRATAIGFILFVLMLSCFFVSFGMSMDRFETGEVEISLAESIASGLVTVLSAPGRFLWAHWASENLPNMLEWVVLVVNSLAWGYAIEYLYVRFKRT